jgi:hypothetical protein
MKLPTIALATLLYAGLGSLPARDQDWKGACSVHFSGKSTLQDFEGDVTAEPFTVKIEGMDDPAKAHASSRVVVKAGAMDTGNEKRDAEMHKCMEVTTYPAFDQHQAGEGRRSAASHDHPFPDDLDGENTRSDRRSFGLVVFG